MTERETLGSVRADVAKAILPLIELLPVDRAMPELVPTIPASHADVEMALRICDTPIFRVCPQLVAGLWLYVDDLYKSHSVSQGLADLSGVAWHAIMHRREGSFSNSRYWLGRGQHHHAFAAIPAFEPMRFVQLVEEAQGIDPAELVDLQRKEWWALFAYCAERAPTV